MENYIFISIQDQTGDSKMKLAWDKNDKEAIEFARKEFLRLQEAGYRILSVKKIMGLFPVKGQEVKEYDPKLGAIYYEKDEEDRGFTFEQIKADNIKYIDPDLFDPQKHEIVPERSYLATKPLRAG